MLQNPSTRFRLFAATFVLAAIALASCSVQSPPVVLAGSTDQAPVGQPLTAVGIKAEAPLETHAVAEAVAIAQPEDTEQEEAVPSEAVTPKAALLEAAPIERVPPKAAPIEVAQLPPSALLAIGAPNFDFGPDDAGQMISRYFGLPRPIPAAPIESPAADQTWPRSAERPPRDLIPAAEYSSPRVIPLERVILVSLRPVVDLPPLGIEAEISRPERPSLPLAPKTELAGPDPLRLPELPALGKMDEGVVTLLDDATGAPFLQSLLSPLGAMRSAGIPFVPPIVIDPLAHTHDFELKNPPPDNDRPARPTAPLPAPVLP